MPVKPSHDTRPPHAWPADITYLTKSRLSPKFLTSLFPFLFDPPRPDELNFTPHPIAHPPHVQIKNVFDSSHPASGQYGLFAKKKLDGGTLIIPYLGIIHASIKGEADEHESSDYDLSLVRLSASDPLNPFPGRHISIGVDAAQAGNAGRFVNDYRGIQPAPNAEFRVGKGEAGKTTMEIWTLKPGIPKGDEILVTYGKGWWSARNGI